MSLTVKARRLPHRGASNDRGLFAVEFLNARLRGFSKDMRICLTGIPSDTREGITHAYFPTLTACCGMLEYLAGFYIGRLDRLGKQQVAVYAEKFLPQPDYDAEAIRILFDAFRNIVAHRAIATGVWIDPHKATKGRRLAWRVLADTKRPALQVIAEAGVITYDSPWACPYTHRVHIHLGRLWRDIADSVELYNLAIIADRTLLNRFFDCMTELYPESVNR